MIIATVVNRAWGDPGKKQNPFTLYFDINLSSKEDIPELDIKAGDVLKSSQSILGRQMTCSNPADEKRIIRDWVNAESALLASQLADKLNPKETPYEVDLTPDEAPEPDPVVIAQQDYNQKRQLLIQAKQDLDIGLIAQADFEAIQTDALTAKTTLATAKSASVRIP